EVHVIEFRLPGAAPSPADLGEGLRHDITRPDHARSDPLAVEVRGGQFRKDEGAVPVRVLEGIDVDGKTIRMGRPLLLAPGPAPPGPPKGCCGVVAIPRGARGEGGGCDEPHLFDRKPQVIDSGEHPDDLRGDTPVDDELARVRSPVEAPEAHRDVGEVVQLDGTVGMYSWHSRLNGLIARTHRELESPGVWRWKPINRGESSVL